MTTPTPKTIKELDKKELEDLFNNNNVLGGCRITADGLLRDGRTIFKMPDYNKAKEWVYVNDTSVVDVITITSEEQKETIKSGFNSVSASVDSPWASAQVEASKENTDDESTTDSHTSFTAVYRYPRGEIRMLPEELKPTDEFSQDVASALEGGNDDEKREKIANLFLKYGDFVTLSVFVGGMLTTTSDEDTSSNKSQEEQKTELKAAVSAKFWSVGASIDGEHKGTSKEDKEALKRSKTLSFEAVGGDETLSQNPVAWQKTVTSYENWRPSKLERPALLTDIPSLFAPTQLTEIKRLNPMPIQAQWVSSIPAFDANSAWTKGLLRYSNDSFSAEKPANLLPGWAILGETSGNHGRVLVLRPSPGINDSEVLKRDYQWNLTWSSEEDPTWPFSIWEPVPNDTKNYAALSCCFNTSSADSVPNIENVVNINKKYLLPGKLGKAIWTDRGSQAALGGTAFEIIPNTDSKARNKAARALLSNIWYGLTNVEDSSPYEGEVWVLNPKYVHVLSDDA